MIKLGLNISLALCCLFGAHVGFAQMDLQRYFLGPNIQRLSLNPAFDLDHSLNLSLGGAYLSVNQSGATFDQIIQVENGVGILDVGAALSEANTQDYIRSNLDIETLQVGFKIKNHLLSFGHSWRLLGFSAYKKEFLELMVLGNAPFIGQELSIGPQYNVTAHHEFYAGYSTKINRFRLGIRAKLLYGTTIAETSEDKILMTTDPDIYQLRFESDYVINSNNLFTLSQLNDIAFNFDDIKINEFSLDNSGVSFDFGLHWSVNDKLDISASVLDIGNITWEKDVVNFTSSGNLEYDGVDITEFIGTDSTVVFLDSLYNVLKFEESQNSFNSPTPTRIYTGATYLLNPSWRIGGVVYYEHFKSATYLAGAISANYLLGDHLGIGVQYGVNSFQLINLGLSFELNIKPIQLFLTTDNILALVDPYNYKSTNARIGLNLIF